MKVPPSPLGGAKFLHALPPFLSADANEGRVRFKWRFDTPERYQDYMIRYYRLITEVDAAVGRLVDELKAQGVYDNTLIVFIGDNGYFHGDRGLADKWYPYEQALRVPLIVRDPRLRAGRRGMTSDRLALNIDIAPTIAAAAGMPVPAVMQGRDLSPLYLTDARRPGATSSSTSIRRSRHAIAFPLRRGSSAATGNMSIGRSSSTNSCSI